MKVILGKKIYLAKQSRIKVEVNELFRSDDGCRLVSSNGTMTQCECNHLTNFAVVMRPINATTAEGILTSIRIDIVVYVVSAVVLAAIIVILIKVKPTFSNKQLFSYEISNLKK